ncbi:LPXTG cell wall anchor domain-containing protein, partial [Streptococcus suis]|nr:LPXTG cell wall anchor domain-containing protein [Streptococcus suis]
KVDETGATATGEVEEGEKTVTYIYTKVETPVVKGTEQLTPPPTQPLVSDAPKTSVILPKTGTNTSVLALVGLSLLGTVVVASRRRKEK